jgi:hypothetical protein
MQQVQKVLLSSRTGTFTVRVVDECGNPMSDKRQFMNEFRTIFFLQLSAVIKAKSNQHHDTNVQFDGFKTKIARQLKLFSKHSHGSAILMHLFA